MKTLTKQTPMNLPRHNTFGLGIDARSFTFAVSASQSCSSFSFWFGLASYRAQPPGL